mgnify:CR=1 FL=1
MWVEHRAKPGTSIKKMKQSGYVTEMHAIEIAESIGFKLVGKSEINQRQRRTETEIDKNRQTEADRDRQRQRQTETETETGRQKERQRDR